MQSVISELQKERTRLEDELHRVTAALTAFGKAYAGENLAGKREPFRLQDARELRPRREHAGQESGPATSEPVFHRFDCYRCPVNISGSRLLDVPHISISRRTFEGPATWCAGLSTFWPLVSRAKQYAKPS